MSKLTDTMTGAAMPWMMGGMVLIWILAFVALILGIAALVKYVSS